MAAAPGTQMIVQTVHDTVHVLMNSPTTVGDRTSIMIWLPNVVLVAVTAYYAYQARQTVKEMQRARAAQVMPKLVPGFAPSGPLVMYPRVVNIGPGAAMDVDCTMKLEPDGPEWRWKWALLQSGEDQEFRPRWKRPDGSDFQPYIAQFEEHFSHLTLTASYEDVTGKNYTTTGRAEIAETVRLFHAVGVHGKTAPVDRLRKSLEEVKAELAGLRSTFQLWSDHLGKRIAVALESRAHMMPWDVQTEFTPLLRSDQLTHAEVHASVVPTRPEGAIETVREAICDAHQSPPGPLAASGLNQACRAHLAQRNRPTYTCWKCRTQF